jgi:tetratricopeptide (TPR) repeat protein
MAYAVESHSETPANAIREALGNAERLVVSISAQNVEEFLVLLDQIEHSLEDLESQDVDLRSEQVRWEGLLRRLSSNPGPIASAAASAGGMKALRAKHPPAESFWWHLDAEVVKRRWTSIRKGVQALILIVVVVGGGVWAVNRFFPADPEALLMVEAQAQLDERILQSDWEGALGVVDETRPLLPGQPELMIWEAVLAEKSGDLARAEASLAEAEAAMENDLEYLWVTTGNYRLMVDNLEGSVEAADAALAINPDSAPAYFLLANVADTRGQRLNAIDLFEKVFELAEEDNPQLAVIAKVRMGQLMQQFDPFESSDPITTTGEITSTDISPLTPADEP